MSRRIITPRPWLTQLREDKSMSATELAEAVDVTDVYIRQIERGKSRPSPDIAISIGRVLGLSETESLVKFFGKSA